jgi:hypothetical protein
VCAAIVVQNKQPIIHVDWSNMDTRKQHILIRASIATQGGSLTLYEEIHPLNLKEKPKTYRLFMQKLKVMLSQNVIPLLSLMQALGSLGSHWKSHLAGTLLAE